MSSSVVEVGEVKYNDWVQREIYLENTGKVTFNFKVLMKSIIRKGLVEVTPLEGKVVGHEKFKF
jgi:hydrocephalus-inducing protein